jgi:alpha,alpha-trehalose phosphorylase
MASLAGGWTALVQGFGGMRQDLDGLLSFRPALPEGIERLAFRLVRGDGVLVVQVKHAEVSYVWRRGSEPLRIRHHDEDLELTAGQPVRRALVPRPDGTAPHQPDGRAPARRRRT